MDANSGATVASLSQHVQVKLVQEDIPGAALEEPLDAQNVTALRWWLQCRGIKLASSWRRHQLITRLDSCRANFKTFVALIFMCMQVLP